MTLTTFTEVFWVRVTGFGMIDDPALRLRLKDQVKLKDTATTKAKAWQTQANPSIILL